MEPSVSDPAPPALPPAAATPWGRRPRFQHSHSAPSTPCSTQHDTALSSLKERQRRALLARSPRPTSALACCGSASSTPGGKSGIALVRMGDRSARRLMAATAGGASLSDDKLAKGLTAWSLGKGLSGFHRGRHCSQLVFPSPLDRFRSGRLQRAQQMGLPATLLEESFDANQSFPRRIRPRQNMAAKRNKGELFLDLSSVATKTYGLEKFRGDDLHSFSFSAHTPGPSKGTFAQTPDSVLGHSYSFVGPSWSTHSLMNWAATGPPPSAIPYTLHNPNKSVITVDDTTLQILMVNDKACQLFDATSEELCAHRLSELFVRFGTGPDSLTEALMESSGNLVLVSGKVLEAVTPAGVIIPVSLWLSRLEYEGNPRCIAVLEPVQRTKATVTFDGEGAVICCDNNLALLLGYQSASDIEGGYLPDFIPSLIVPDGDPGSPVPKELSKQHCTGRTKEGTTFPLTIHLEAESDQSSYYASPPSSANTTTTTYGLQQQQQQQQQQLQQRASDYVTCDSVLRSLVRQSDHQLGSNHSSLVCEAPLSAAPSVSSLAGATFNESWCQEVALDPCSVGGAASAADDLKASVYTGVVWVFANISGMIAIRPDGSIHSCNHYFALTLFGYGQNQLVGKNISHLIPSFYDDLEFLDVDSALFPPYEEDEDDFGSSDDCDATSITDDALVHDHHQQQQQHGRYDNNGLVSTEDLANNLANELNSVLHLQHHHQTQQTTTTTTTTTQATGQDSDANRTNTTLYIATKSPCDNQHNVSLFDNVANTTTTTTCSSSPKMDNAELTPDGNTPATPRADSNSTVVLLDANCPATAADINGNRGLNGDAKTTTSTAPVTPSSGSNSTRTLTHESTASSSEATRACSSAATDDEECAVPAPIMSVPPPPPASSSNYPTSTPSKPALGGSSAASLAQPPPRIMEGSYFGLGHHRDGSELPVVYQVRRVDLDDGQTLFCVWVSRDPDEPAEGFRLTTSVGMASSVNSSLDISSSVFYSGQAGNEHQGNATDLSSNQSSVDYSAADCTMGPYSVPYTTLQLIGKGAFGCVKMAYRNTDKMLVVTKFIRKSKVYKECWVEDNNLQKCVPLEVSLLTTLNHPNIVKVLDVFENDDYFQLVMEKHGCGMDLFEFIDRGPQMDEALASYLFRQVASAVSYLHSLNILHRDIKDENIILDEKFHVKLIDFGSSTFMTAGRLFSTFCGTVEYCSPEVLNGDKYRGPELELWSLGVTLYTLIFGENPFFDIDETLRSELHPPFAVSKDLMSLISHLLNPDPALRCTLRDLDVNKWVHQPITLSNYRFEDVVNCIPEEAFPAKSYSDLE